jgi:hypothetical protein
MIYENLDFLQSITVCTRYKGESTLTFINRMAIQIDGISEETWDTFSPFTQNILNVVILSTIKR